MSCILFSLCISFALKSYKVFEDLTTHKSQDPTLLVRLAGVDPNLVAMFVLRNSKYKGGVACGTMFITSL